MDPEDQQEITSDERIWAALAHGSILLFGLGVFVPVGVWISQREKSTWVSFHALQALFYSLLQQIIIITLVMVVMCPMVLITPLLAEPSVQSGDPGLASLPMLGFMLWPFCAFGLYFGLGLLGAVLCAFGIDFRYPLIGGWVARFLTKEDNA